MIGHNPGLHNLALALADADSVGGKFPSGALATFSFEGRWRELRPRSAHLASFDRRSLRLPGTSENLALLSRDALDSHQASHIAGGRPSSSIVSCRSCPAEHVHLGKVDNLAGDKCSLRNAAISLRCERDGPGCATFAEVRYCVTCSAAGTPLSKSFAG
jgi:hypothetical protein